MSTTSESESEDEARRRRSSHELDHRRRLSSMEQRRGSAVSVERKVSQGEERPGPRISLRNCPGGDEERRHHARLDPGSHPWQSEKQLFFSSQESLGRRELSGREAEEAAEQLTSSSEDEAGSSSAGSSSSSEKNNEAVELEAEVSRATTIESRDGLSKESAVVDLGAVDVSKALPYRKKGGSAPCSAPGFGRRKSYTEENVSELADGKSTMRPRGAETSSGDDKASSFTTRAHRARVYRSPTSRVVYCCTLLNIVVWTPLWLKLLTVRRRESRKGDLFSLYNASIQLEMRVSAFDDERSSEKDENPCVPCSKSVFGVTYPITATVRNFHANDRIPTATYVSVLASYDFQHWFVVSKPGSLTGLEVGSNYRQLCRDDEGPLEDDDLVEPIDDEVLIARAVAAATNTGQSAAADSAQPETYFTIQERYENGVLTESVRQHITQWSTKAPTPYEARSTEPPTEFEPDEDTISRCCLDQPGFIYLVACATPFEFIHKADWYDPVDPPPFQALCRALDGRCGAACGVQANAPVQDSCDARGRIPLDLLLDKRVLDDDDHDDDDDRRRRGRRLSPSQDTTKDASDDPRWYDRRFETTSLRAKLYLNSFVVFVTVMCVGTWVSFFAGTGHLDEPLKPSMSEVEAYLGDVVAGVDQDLKEAHQESRFRELLAMTPGGEHLGGALTIHDTTKGERGGATSTAVIKRNDKKQPLCLVAFAISAAEPRMMVLRNMCGKCMSWIFQRKFTLGVSGADVGSVFDSCDHDDHHPSELGPRQSRTARRKRVAALKKHVECVDIFQDEGHRVGTYALWDAFVELVNGSDLRFVEAMADKMTTMTADDDCLDGNRGSDTLLDDDLRKMLETRDVGVQPLHVSRLELAFSVYKLLNELGHHAFWAPDPALRVVAFRDLCESPDAVATLKLWATNFARAQKNGGTPFSRHVVPKNTPGIDRTAWSGWWELYNEQGRQQHAKRYDCTKFRLVRLYYDRPQTGASHHRDVMMVYAARANPEDLKNKLAPTRNKRGTAAGCFVRLKTTETVFQEKLFKAHGLRRLSRSEARRCHARVCSKVRMMNPVTGRYEKHVKVKECTPELLRLLPARFLVHAGASPSNEDDRDSDDDDTLSRFPSSQHGGGSPAIELLGKKRQKKNDGRRASALSAFGGYFHGTRMDGLGERYASRVRHVQGEEAVLPVSLIQPLRESRGKSGGMNHAMEILNYYLRHHSNTMGVMQSNASTTREDRENDSTKNLIEAKSPITGKKQVVGEVPENADSNPVAACLLFAIFDCRHMATQGFWDAVIPYFYAYKKIDNPWARDLVVDRPVAFVQLPQSFTSLTVENDVFDMRNEYLFRLANNVRSGVGAITSCGTNAVWNYDLKLQRDPLTHRFNELTMIEDTASSHDVIMAGRKGVYHFERLVLGAKKGTNDYLAAVFRWSRGAVQLSWTTFWYPLSRDLWPYAVLVFHVAPTIATVAYLQSVQLNECNTTRLGSRLGLAPCHSGPVVGLLLDPVFLSYAILCTTWAAASFLYHRFGAYVVMFENVTYFLTSCSAFYWCSIPPYMAIAKHGVPGGIFDTHLLTAGALWLQFNSAVLIYLIKQWSPLENGNAPSDQSLLRSQQMYIITAPLHVMAILAGCQDGVAIVFGGKDASRWSSFDSVMALTLVKLWVVGLASVLGLGVAWGLVNVCIIDDDFQERGIRLLGVFFCLLLLYIIELPLRGLFFYQSVVKQQSRPSKLDKLTAAVFGRKQPIRPDYIYLALWVFLLAFAMRNLDSDGIFNGRKRCSLDRSDPACVHYDYSTVTRSTGTQGQGLGMHS